MFLQMFVYMEALLWSDFDEVLVWFVVAFFNFITHDLVVSQSGCTMKSQDTILMQPQGTTMTPILASITAKY